jgi:Na+-transporting NADH:ubiquinone oxidoreductase subunit B
MKFLSQALQSVEKHFEKGGKLEKLYPLYEAGASILLSTKETTQSTVHVRDSLDTKRYMIIVVMSLIPCTLFGIYNAGYQTLIAAGETFTLGQALLTGSLSVVPIILVSYVIGGLVETVFALIRGHEINEGFLVTGLLFPLTLPPTIPLWQVAIGITFGVIVGKEVFGGSGRNFLNPALTARAFVFFTYPAYISGEVWTKVSVAKDQIVDGWSGATALAVAVLTESPQTAQNALLEAGFTLKDLVIGFVPGSIGETSVLCVLIGAVILLVTGVGSWRTMLGCLLGALSMSLIFNLFSGSTPLSFFGLSPIWQLE